MFGLQIEAGRNFPEHEKYTTEISSIYIKRLSIEHILFRCDWAAMFICRAYLTQIWHVIESV